MWDGSLTSERIWLRDRTIPITPLMHQPLLSRVEPDLASGLVFALSTAVASRIAVYAVGYVAHLWLGGYGSALEAFCHFDCGLYAGILRDGYQQMPPGGLQAVHGGMNWAFFPLFPLLGRLVSVLIPVAPEMALLIAGNLAFLLAIVALYTYGREAFDARFGRALALICCFSPYSIYYSIGYAEPVFLLTTAIAFLLWSRERYLPAGIAAAAASASRLVGGFLALALAVAAFNDGILRRLPRLRARDLSMIGGVLITPAGFVLFTLYLYWLTGDAFATFDSERIGWDRVPGDPIKIFRDALFSSNPVYVYFGVVTAIGFGLVGYLAWRRHWPEAIFLLAGILAPLSSMAWAMPRFIFGLMPVYVALTMIVRDLHLPLAGVVGVLALLDAAATIGWVGGVGFLQ